MTQICKVLEAVRSSAYYNSSIVFVNGAPLHQSATTLQPATSKTNVICQAVNPWILAFIFCGCQPRCTGIYRLCYEMHRPFFFFCTNLWSHKQISTTVGNNWIYQSINWHQQITRVDQTQARFRWHWLLRLFRNSSRIIERQIAAWGFNWKRANFMDRCWHPMMYFVWRFFLFFFEWILVVEDESNK